jgi:hypothetical protein
VADLCEAGWYDELSNKRSVLVGFLYTLVSRVFPALMTRQSRKASLDLGLLFLFLFFEYSALFYMKRLGLGDLGAGRRKDATHASEKIEGL